MKTKAVLDAEALQQSHLNPIVQLPDTDQWLDPRNPGSIPPILCCGDYVAVAPFAPAITSSGGIVLPQAQPTANRHGLVLAAGPEAANKVRVGSVVLYSSKPLVADLTGLIAGFDKKLDLVRPQNLLCILALPQNANQVDPITNSLE